MLQPRLQRWCAPRVPERDEEVLRRRAPARHALPRQPLGGPGPGVQGNGEEEPARGLQRCAGIAI